MYWNHEISFKTADISDLKWQKGKTNEKYKSNLSVQPQESISLFSVFPPHFLDM